MLLYTDDVVLFSYTLANMKHLLDVLNTFNQISDQMLMWARQNYDNKGNTNKTLPTFTYKGQRLQKDKDWMTQNSCITLFLCSYILILLFYFRMANMKHVLHVLNTFDKISD